MACAVGGDHPTSGSHVEAVSVPVSKIGGLEAYILLEFCEQHLHQADLWDLEPGTQLSGRIQFGVAPKTD